MTGYTWDTTTTADNEPVVRLHPSGEGAVSGVTKIERLQQFLELAAYLVFNGHAMEIDDTYDGVVWVSFEAKAGSRALKILGPLPNPKTKQKLMTILAIKYALTLLGI